MNEKSVEIVRVANGYMIIGKRAMPGEVRDFSNTHVFNDFQEMTAWLRERLDD